MFIDNETSSTNSKLPLPREAVENALRIIRGYQERGLSLQAWNAAKQSQLYPPPDLSEALVLLGRITWQLGAPGFSRWLFRRAWKLFPHDPEVRYYHALQLAERRGPYATWRFLRDGGDLADNAADDTRASWYALHGQIAGALRDFDLAESWLCRADQIAPDSPWVHVCWSHLFECEDRYDEAVDIARRALTLRPWYRPAVQALGHLLTLHDRDDEAVAFLKEAAHAIECGPVAGQCYGVMMELKQYDEAAAMLQRFEELSPLLEKKFGRWFEAQRSELAYYRGDYDSAAEHAQRAKGKFFTTIAERLADPQRRAAASKTLPVPFVRQHHVTCVPATLSAISRYWSMPVDHVQLADEICYNGTSSYSERNWANTHGWFTREFSITEESAAALIDRDIPFTFTTLALGMAHLQAMIGYDARRGTLLVRDPTWRNTVEGLGSELLEKYRSSGPRGMAMVPTEQREKLADLSLPDAELWDNLHELDGALIQHRRADANVILDRMTVQWPDALLVTEARRRLAVYDANPTALLAAVEVQLAKFSDDERLIMSRLACLRDLSRRPDRLETFAAICVKRDSHPIFWQQYAQELSNDARRHDEAIELLQRAIRYAPTESGNLYLLASIYWDRNRFEEACELYRFAACLDDKDEQLAMAYFGAAQYLKQTDAAIDFLRGRFQRLGRKSSLPARTLHDAYIRLERTSEALDVLWTELQQRPDDGSFRLFAAVAYLGSSLENSPHAESLLQQAKGKTSQAEWLRTAARIAAIRDERAVALQLWREYVELQPLAMDGHMAISRLLMETDGRSASLAYLQAVTDRFPNYLPLWELRCEVMREEAADVREPVLRRLLEQNPDHAWGRRELGLFLVEEKRFDEARVECDLATRLDPSHGASFLLRARLHLVQDQIEEARAALHDAIRLSVDNDFAIAQLMETCSSPTERRAELAFVRAELERQVIFGDGLLAFRQFARETFEPQELLVTLQEAWKQRPDLWHAWSACALQHVSMNQLDEAWKLIQQATRRFPLLPKLWHDQAVICRVRGDSTGEIEALQTAHRINPSWNDSLLALSAAYSRRNDFAAARRLIESGLTRSPREAVLHAELADLLWQANEREAALQHMDDAVRLEPGYDYAWQQLHEWSNAQQTPARPVAAARSLTTQRPHEARSWLMLAKMLSGDEQLEECLAALDKVIALNPKCVEAHERKSLRLSAVGRFDEARAACHPSAWPGYLPIDLRVREAEIFAEQGDVSAAVAAVRAVLVDEPNSYFAWSKLASWFRTLNDVPQYREACEALARIAPHQPVSLGYLGEARLMQDDRAGARAAFARAFDLDPAYEFAAFWVFDMQVEDNDLVGAAESLARMRGHVTGPLFLAREAQLAARQGNQAIAWERLRELCVTPFETSWPISNTVEEMEKAGWKSAAEEALATALDQENVQPEVGSQWGRLVATAGQASYADRLRELAARNAAGRMATYSYLETLVRLQRETAAQAFIQKNEYWLGQQTHTWGTVGYVWATVRNYSATTTWMSDWRERTDAESWMLVNAAEGFRNVGRDDEAHAVSRHAVTLKGNGRHLHRVLLAIDDALADNLVPAREVVAEIEFESLDTDYRFVWVLLDCLTKMADATADTRAATFRSVRHKLYTTRAAYTVWNFEPARQRMYRRTLGKLSQLHGGWGAKLWAWWKWIASW